MLLASVLLACVAKCEHLRYLQSLVEHGLNDDVVESKFVEGPNSVSSVPIVDIARSRSSSAYENATMPVYDRLTHISRQLFRYLEKVEHLGLIQGSTEQDFGFRNVDGVDGVDDIDDELLPFNDVTPKAFSTIENNNSNNKAKVCGLSIGSKEDKMGRELAITIMNELAVFGAGAGTASTGAASTGSFSLVALFAHPRWKRCGFTDEKNPLAEFQHGGGVLAAKCLLYFLIR